MNKKRPIVAPAVEQVPQLYSPAASAHLAIGELLLRSVSLAKGELFGYRRVLTSPKASYSLRELGRRI